MFKIIAKLYIGTFLCLSVLCRDEVNDLFQIDSSQPQSVDNVALKMFTINHINLKNRLLNNDLFYDKFHICTFENNSFYFSLLFAEYINQNMTFNKSNSKLRNKEMQFYSRVTDICDNIRSKMFDNNLINNTIKALINLNLTLNDNERYMKSKLHFTDDFSFENYLNNIENCFTFNDNFIDFDDTNKHFKLNQTQTKYLVCFDVNEFNSLANTSRQLMKSDKYMPYLYELYEEHFATICFIKNIGVGLLISAVFLTITTVVYCILPELRKTVYGKCVLFYLVSMVIAYGSFGVRLSFSGQLGSLCCVVGYLFHFAWIASFSWQSVMCFDILLALSSLRWPAGSSKSGNRKRLILYCLYAYGLPGLFTLTTMALQFGPFLDDNSEWNPNIGGRFCFFQTNTESAHRVRWLYFCGPYATVIVINVCMFVLTAFLIHSHSSGAKAFNGIDSRRCCTSGRRRHNELFQVHLNLFFVMGSNWILEVVVMIKDNAGITSGWFFRMIDYFNTSIGLVLFIVLVCKPQVMKKLKAKLTGKPVVKCSNASSKRTERNFIANCDRSSCITSLSTLSVDLPSHSTFRP